MFVNLLALMFVNLLALMFVNLLGNVKESKDENEKDGGEDTMDVDDQATKNEEESSDDQKNEEEKKKSSQKDTADPKAEAEKKKEALNEEEKKRQARAEKLGAILSGNKTIYLHLQFLMRNDKSDMQILKLTKDTVRVSICHTATVIANGFMHCGTTHDSFLRDNLDWLSRATNWAKFSATASLGAIHRGHENESLALMQSYLPKDSSNSSGYAEGGGLYALGLIHANHGGDITEYLLGQVSYLKDSCYIGLKTLN
jgi:26S proteasome regulatory subunit N2